MTVTEILKVHPRPLIGELTVLARCTDECYACAATCTICADACLGEEDVRDLVCCIRLCLDCADDCVETGRIVSRQTDPDRAAQRTALEACLAALSACAA